MRPLGIGIATWLVLGILVAVDHAYNHGQALSGLGQLAHALVPELSTAKQ